MAFSGYRSIKGLELFPPVGTQNPARVFVRGADINTPAGRLALRYAVAHAQDFYVRAATQFSLSIVAFTKFSTTMPDGDRVLVTFNGPDTMVQIDVAPRVSVLMDPDTPEGRVVYVIRPMLPNGNIAFPIDVLWFLYPEGSARGARWKSTGKPPKDFTGEIGTHGGAVGPSNVDAISWTEDGDVFSKGQQIGQVNEALGTQAGTGDTLGGLVGHGRALLVTFQDAPEEDNDPTGQWLYVLSFDLAPEPGVINQNLRVEFSQRLNEWGELLPPIGPVEEPISQVDWFIGISVSPDKRRLILVMLGHIIDVLMEPLGGEVSAEEAFTVDVQSQPKSPARKTYREEKVTGAPFEYPYTVDSDRAWDQYSTTQYVCPEWIYPDEDDEPIGHAFNWITAEITDTGESHSATYSQVNVGTEGSPIVVTSASASAYSRVEEAYLHFPDGEKILVNRIDLQAEPFYTSSHDNGQATGEQLGTLITYNAYMGAGLAHGHRRVVREETTVDESAPVPALTGPDDMHGILTNSSSTDYTQFLAPYQFFQPYYTNRYVDQGELGRSILYSHRHSNSGINGSTSHDPEVLSASTVYTGAWDTVGVPVDLISVLQAGATAEYPDPGFASLPEGWFSLFVTPW